MAIRTETRKLKCVTLGLSTRLLGVKAAEVLHKTNYVTKRLSAFSFTVLLHCSKET